MKFKIRTDGLVIDILAVQKALVDIDPAAMIDFDKTTHSVRVSTCLDDAELLKLIRHTGFPIPAENLQGLPSDCCGGCSG